MEHFGISALEREAALPLMCAIAATDLLDGRARLLGTRSAHCAVAGLSE